MSDRNFPHPKTGQPSGFPWDRQQALELGFTRWMDENGCDKGCYPGPKTRYCIGNGCSVCLSQLAEQCWPLWIQGSPDRPEPWATTPEQARAAGINYYYGSVNFPKMCQNGEHLRKTHILTGRCVGCEEDARAIAAILRGPRAAARATGYKTYQPAESCPSCGTQAPRNVQTNACDGCKDDDGRKTASRLFAEANSEFIISKVDARGLGFTLYRTGDACSRGHRAWRYVSTGNCVECLK